MVHTVAVFSFLTMGAAISRDVFLMSYINGREFAEPGVTPGPLGFQLLPSLRRQAICYLSYLVFPFNQWLSDGLLVSAASGSVAHASNVAHSFSCTVVL